MFKHDNIVYLLFFPPLSVSCVSVCTKCCRGYVPLFLAVPVRFKTNRVTDSRASARPRENCSRNNRNSNHFPLWSFPGRLVLFPAASTRGLNSRMETNRPLANEQRPSAETTEERKRKARELCALSSMGRNKGQGRKNGNKRGEREKGPPQCATKCNDALSKVARIELVAVLIREYWSNRAVVCVLNSVSRCF